MTRPQLVIYEDLVERARRSTSYWRLLSREGRAEAVRATFFHERQDPPQALYADVDQRQTWLDIIDELAPEG